MADRDTTVGLVPAGYAEGVPRAAGNVASVWVDDRLRPIRGRVCMDQFMIDLDGDLPPPGTDVVLFGPGSRGEPTAQDWADALDTINYEIVTRVGGRFSRRHVTAGARMSVTAQADRRGRGRLAAAAAWPSGSPSAAG